MSAQEVRYVVEVEGERHEVAVGADGLVGIGGRRRAASLEAAGPGGAHSLLLDGASVPVVARTGERGRWEIAIGGRIVDVLVLEAREAEIRKGSGGRKGGAGVAPLKAPMPGLVVGVAVREGDVVQPGTAILIVEAMKMENELRAAAAARISRILVAPGDAVDKGQVLAEFEELVEP